MKLTKVFFGDKRLRDIYVGATKWQVFKYRLMRFVRKTLIVAFLLGAIYGSFHLGRVTTDPVTVFAEKEVIKEVETSSNVMERIAKCESGGIHYRNGQVILNANSNGSVDIGYFQINSVWSKKASELKLDLTKEEDNKKFALWLYKNRGTEDWYSSKACWNK